MKKRNLNYLTNINGTPGDDVLIGTADNDIIDAGGGNDTLIGGHASDILIGGAGNDDFRVEETDDLVQESVGGGFDRIYSEADYYFIRQGQEIEFLAFSDPASTRNATLEGNEFAQTIIGSAGNNDIYGRGGIDVMAGLGGNDTYQVEQAGDVVLEDVGGGNDIVYVNDSVGSYALQAGAEIELLVYGGTLSVQPPAFNLTGNEFANFIRGQLGKNILIGGGGDDTLDGFGGSDTYRIDDFGDFIIESFLNSNADIDSVYVAMNLSGYTLNADAEIEVLAAIDPSSTVAFNLNGNGAAQTIFGTAGVNILIGGDGIDTLAGFGGNDVYRVEEAGDKVVEAAGGGYDSVYAVTSYTLAAGSEVEVLATLEPALTDPLSLTGNEFANEIYGNDGANLLDGKVGDDLLFGRAGADTFAFTVSADSGNVDTIGDFLAGTDKIGLDDSIFAGIALPGTPGIPGPFNANSFAIGTAAADADDRIIYDQTTGRLFYDFDGNGAGAAYQFAVLAGTPVLAASDFVVI